MSAFSTVMAASAASNAAAANRKAEEARDAAESVVDGQARFIVLPIAKFEKIPGQGFFSLPKEKFVGEQGRMTIKNTDIARITEEKDDFGNTYAVIVLERRGYIQDEDGTLGTLDRLPLSLSLQDATDLVNGLVKV